MAGGLSMPITPTDAERADLEHAAAGERRVRHWQRYRALLLLGGGTSAEQVAAVLDCAPSSVYAWAGAGEARLSELLASDP
jgi:uncharacterized Fe-S cluster-containing radical SAM superfamily protein